MEAPNSACVPIAVIGMSFKFPEDATTDDSFWKMLLAGRCTAKKVPDDRFAAENFYNHDTNRLDRLPNQVGHFVKGDVGAFDAPFFSITPQEAAAMDPQSRALLETAYRALENAGLPLQECSGKDTSVYIGCSGNDYQLMYAKDPERPIRHAATGMASNMLANKISWFYNLHGPSMTIDTACSSSLNAVHLACQSLQTGNANMALVGGVELYLTPDSMAPLAHLNFLSPDGRCFSFDHRANGYGRGEGYGLLVLKRLADAIKANDQIRAVIRATGSNENGRTSGGIAKVNLAAQQDLIRKTYEKAGLDLAQTRYFEAHGPGTGGDIVECAAFAAVFAEYRTPQDPLHIGSVKANIGHLEGASGVPALVKTILSLERGVIPKSANFRRLHPDIAAKSYPFSFPEQNISWPAGLRRVSINSFGFGGSNAHVVVEDAQHHLLSIAHARRESPTCSTPSEGHSDTEAWVQIPHEASGCHNVAQMKRLQANGLEQPHDSGEMVVPPGSTRNRLFVLSAADENGLSRVIDAFNSYLQQQNGSNGTSSDDTLKHLSYTLNNRRTHLPWRAFAVAESMSGIGSPQKFSKGLRAVDKPQIGFVFNGQGSQWAQMGLELLHYQVFKQALDECQATFEQNGSKWKLLEELGRPQATTKVNNAEFSQPLCTAIQIALVCLLRSFGVHPIAVVGHSSGEMAAAFCMGALSLHAACKVAFFRGIYSQQLQDTEEDICGMMAVNISVEEATNQLERVGQTISPLKVSIACVNSPLNVTLSGNRSQLELLGATLESQEIFVRLLNIRVAYHSQYLTKVASAYERAIGTLESGNMTSSGVQFFSTVYGKPIDAKDLLEPGYWIKNLTSPVLFSDALKSLCTDVAKNGMHVLIEIGPHGALRVPVEQTLDTVSTPTRARCFSALSRNTNDEQSFLQLLGSLHCLGCAVHINVKEVYGQPKLLKGLPEYPFDHSRSYWHESRLSKNFRQPKFPRSDFLGNRVPDWNASNPRWRNIIRTLENPWIEDHRIVGILLYPGAGMLVMAIEAAAQYGLEHASTPLTGFRLKDVSFLKSLNISQAPGGTETQIVLRPLKDAGDRRVTWSAFNLYLYENEDFTEVCNGLIALEYEEPTNPVDGEREAQNRISNIQSRFRAADDSCNRKVTTETMYDRLKDIGLGLGPTFKTFDNVRGNGMHEAMADIKLLQWTCKGSLEQTSPHFVHPTSLDGIIQSGIVALSNAGDDKLPAMVPSRIGNMWISADGLNGLSGSRINCYSNGEFKGYREALMNVVALSTADNVPRVIVDGLEMTIFDLKKDTAAEAQKTCYQLTWESIEQQDDKVTLTTHTSLHIPGKDLPVMLVTSATNELTQLASEVQANLRKIGFQSCEITTLLEVSKTLPPQNAIVMFFLDVGKSYLKDIADKEFYMLKKVLTQLRHVLWIVTDISSGDQQIAGEIMGLSRVLRTEHENLKMVTLQFESSENLVENVTNSLLRNLRPKAVQSPSEMYEPEQLIKTNGDVYVSRLKPWEDMDQLLAVKEKPIVRDVQPFGSHPELKLGIGVPGSLDTFQFEQDTTLSKVLAEHEIEVRPVYAGLNFMDCLTALGRIPQSVLGIECSGIVVRSGATSNLVPGDRVMVCGSGTFASLMHCHYLSAIKIPDNMDLKVAAALPGTGGTAYHALHNVARLQAGETILIHAGAGATGQMAIQVALNLGATVYVSVGSPEKVQHVMRDFKIPESNIFYSRNTAFGDAIRRVTNGRGVDVVLNSLAGDSLVASWECIASFGRFVEIGKRDIYSHKSLPMFPFARNVSFHTVDLAGIWMERPSLMRKIHMGVLKLWQEGKLQVANPLHVFPIGQVEEAFRLLQSGKCTGKVVLHMDPESMVSTSLPPQATYLLNPDVTYVISGGLGGLGRSAAQWMVSRNAKHLLLLSRSGPKTPEAVQLVDEFRANGINVEAPACDITDREKLAQCLQECSQHMPPIGGCIQGAMVLRDKYFTDMTFEDWQESLKPKTQGSWNLHSLLPPDMTFFILLSSMSGIVGGAGQSNYAAGNTFQDALARHRISKGLKAVSLDLGLMEDIGVVASNPKLMHSMTSNGFYLPMTQSNLHTLLDHYCNPSLPQSTETTSQLTLGIALPSQIRSRGAKEPIWMHQPLFTSFWTQDATLTSLTSDSAQFTSSYRTLLATSPTLLSASNAISDALVLRLSRSLCIPPTDIERSRPLHFYGVDSLVAVELRNWFLTELQSDVAIFELLGNRGCDDLARLAVGKSNFRNREWKDSVEGEVAEEVEKSSEG